MKYRQIIQHYIDEIQELIATEKQELIDLENSIKYGYSQYRHGDFSKEKSREKINLIGKIVYLQGKLDAYVECIKL